MKNKSYFDESMDADELEEMMHQMNKMYKELQKAREMHSNVLKDLDTKLVAMENVIQETARKAANDMMVSFRDRATHEIKVTVEKSLHDSCAELREVSQHAKFVAQTQHKEISFLSKCIIGTAIFFSICGGLLGGLTVHYFIPEVTPELEQKLKEASWLEDIWPKLSKKRQDEMVELASQRSTTKKRNK